MPPNIPDMDLLSLAALAKSGLKQIDDTSIGGSPRADKIDIRTLAGLGNTPVGSRGQPPMKREQNPNPPNILGGLDFIEMPKSRPIGRFDLDGTPLAPVDYNRPIDFADIPESIEENVAAEIRNISSSVSASVPKRPSEPVDFDLFQHSTLKDIIDKLNIGISNMEDAINQLKERRDVFICMLNNGKS